MTQTRFKILMVSLGKRERDAVADFGVSRRTVARWRAEEYDPEWSEVETAWGAEAARYFSYGGVPPERGTGAP